MAKLFLAALLVLFAVSNAAVLTVDNYADSNCTMMIVSRIVSPLGRTCQPNPAAAALPASPQYVMPSCNVTEISVTPCWDEDCTNCTAMPSTIPAGSCFPNGMGGFAQLVCSMEQPEPIPSYLKLAAYADMDCAGTPTFIRYSPYECHSNATGNYSTLAYCNGTLSALRCPGLCRMDMSLEGCVPTDLPYQAGCNELPSMGDHGHQGYVDASCVPFNTNTNTTESADGSSTSGGSGSSTGAGSGSSTSGGSGSSTGGSGSSTGGSTTAPASTTSQDVSGSAAVVAGFVLVAIAAIAAL